MDKQEEKLTREQKIDLKITQLEKQIEEKAVEYQQILGYIQALKDIKNIKDDE